MPTPAAITRDWVIDCDTHITEPPDVWTARLPAKFRDRAPTIVHDEKMGWDVWKIGEAQSLLTVGHTAVAGWPEPFPSAPRTFAEVPRAAHDAKARLEYMDSIGVWAMALYPNVGGFGNEAFLKLGDPELMLACVQAYNDFQIDWISPDPRRFIPILATPFWDPVASAREIERSAARGHRGVLFTGEPQKFGFPTLADPHWDPLWAAAQDTGLPISFHIGSGSLTEEFTPENDEELRDGRAQRAHHRRALPRERQAARRPPVLGRARALPEARGRLGRERHRLHPVHPRGGRLRVRVLEGAARAADLRDEAERVLPRQVYGCYFFEEFAPQQLIDRIGVDRILFETDYPHPVCLYGNVREKIDAGLAGQPPEVRRKLLWENAAKLYKVPEPDRPVPIA